VAGADMSASSFLRALLSDLIALNSAGTAGLGHL
jgi:hypothetical protein